MVHENPGSEEVIAKAGNVDILVRLLRCEATDVATYVLWALSLSINEHNQKKVVDAEGIPSLVTLLSDTEQRTREQAARAIRRLAHNNVETQRLLVQHGATDPLITLLPQALSKLNKLVAHVPVTKTVAAASHATAAAESAAGLRDGFEESSKERHLIEVHEGRPAESLEDAPAAPAGAPAGGAEGLEAPDAAPARAEGDAPEGAPASDPLLESPLDSPSSSEGGKRLSKRTGSMAERLASAVIKAKDETLQHAVAALAELASLPANASAIFYGGSIPPLVHVLQNEHCPPETKTHAAATLALLSMALSEEPSEKEATSKSPEKRENREDRKSAERTSVGDEADLTAAPATAAADAPSEKADGSFKDESKRRSRRKTKSGDGSQHAGPNVTEVIADAGAIPALVELLRGGCGPNAQKEAAVALKALAHNEINRVAIAEADGIAPLVDLLGSTTQAVRSNAEGTLVRLSLNAQHRAHIIEQLVGMLGSESGGQEQAAFTLANLARELPESRPTILEHGGIPKLLGLCTTGRMSTKEHAVSAIAEIAKQNLKAQNVITEADGIPILVATLIRCAISADLHPAMPSPPMYTFSHLPTPSHTCPHLPTPSHTFPHLLTPSHTFSHLLTIFLVATLTSSNATLKEALTVELCALAALAIWHVADSNRDNQTRFLKEGTIPPLVGLLGSTYTQLRSNASGAIAVLARGHAEVQATLVRCQAITLLCAALRDSLSQHDAIGFACQEESALALHSLTSEASNAVKGMVSKAGAIGLLMNLLSSPNTTERGVHNAAISLAAIARGDNENLKAVTHALTAAISARVPHHKAVKLLSALTLLCGNGRASQEAVANEPGVFVSLVSWLTTPSKDVQVQAARVILALGSNNATTQQAIGTNGAVSPLVKLLEIKFVEEGVFEAQEYSACALWHLAGRIENRNRMANAVSVQPLVLMLGAEGELVPRLGAMLLVRLANHSPELVSTIVSAGGIVPLVKLLTFGTPASQQMASQALGAIASVTTNRDDIVDAEAIKPLVKLLSSHEMGTPEAAARTLAHLARDDGEDRDDDDKDDDEDDPTGAISRQRRTSTTRPPPWEIDKPQRSSANTTGLQPPEADRQESTAGAKRPGMERKSTAGAKVDADVGAKDSPEGKRASTPPAGLSDAQLLARQKRKNGTGGCAYRRKAMNTLGATKALIKMLDGSNLGETRQPSPTGGWAAVHVGEAGCHETEEVFPGSQADFGVKIGMQEQAAATLAQLACGDVCMQDTIIEMGGVPPLLSLVKCGSPLAQEHAARTIWYLAGQLDNQRTLVQDNTIQELIMLLKSGSPSAQTLAAAAIAELAQGYILETHGKTIAFAISINGKIQHVPKRPEDEEHDGKRGRKPSFTTAGPPAAARVDRLNTIGVESQGITPLIQVCKTGSLEGKAKAAAALWHLALDLENRKFVGANGGINPIASLLGISKAPSPPKPPDHPQPPPPPPLPHESFGEAQASAFLALARLAVDSVENQAMIAKCLVAMLDNDDIDVERRAVCALLSLAMNNKGSHGGIVKSGAITPLVNLLTNSRSDDNRIDIVKLLHKLAIAHPDHHAGIAAALVELLGVGTAQAQEHVTTLLLHLSPSGPENRARRLAVAKTNPFKMLLRQIKSTNARVKMLSSQLLANLASDGGDNLASIAREKGIKPLIGCLETINSNPMSRESTHEIDSDTQESACLVLAEMARAKQEYANRVADEGGIPLCVKLLAKGSIKAKAQAADAIRNLASGHAAEVEEAGAVEHLVKLLGSNSLESQELASHALTGIAAGGRTDAIKNAGGIELLVGLLRATRTKPGTPERVTEEAVKAHAANTLSELARDSPETQDAIMACQGGIEALVEVVNKSSAESAKARAAGALWRLASQPNGNALVVKAGGIASLVALAGSVQGEGELESANALSTLAVNQPENQRLISELLVKQLREAAVEDGSMARAARAISPFVKAAATNQDAVATAGGVELLVSLLDPKPHSPAMMASMGRQSTVDLSNGDSIHAQHDRHAPTQKELAAAIWWMSNEHPANQKAFAHAGGIPLLISLLDDHPDVRFAAAGALWSLSAHPDNRQLLAEAGGIPKLVDLLRVTKSMLGGRRESREDTSGDAPAAPAAPVESVHETAAGALHSLSARVENRSLIVEADGIARFVPMLFEAVSVTTRTEVSGALLALTTNDPDRAYVVVEHLVEALQKHASNSKDDDNPSALQVLHELSLENANIEAFAKTGVIVQLVNQLNGGSEAAQKLAASALTQAARMSIKMRIQVSQQIVLLLTSASAEVRQRAGALLRGALDTSKQVQKEATTASGVGPLVDLLKDRRGFVEAQEYALRSLSLITDTHGRAQMAHEGIIEPLIHTLKNSALSVTALEHAAALLATLTLDAPNHQEIIEREGIPPLVSMLRSAQPDEAPAPAPVGPEKSFKADKSTKMLRAAMNKVIETAPVAQQSKVEFSTTAKRFAANALARLAANESERQVLLFEAGVVPPLVNWLRRNEERAEGEETIDRSLRPVAALALADVARGNHDVQTHVAQAGAVEPLVTMLERDAGADAHEAACAALATLAKDHPANQTMSAKAGAVPLLVGLIAADRIKERIRENAAHALAMLAADAENKVLIAQAGGISPLVHLLEAGGITPKTQQSAAQAVGFLAQANAENQLALVQRGAAEHLANMLGSDLLETQDYAQRALLHLSLHDDNRTAVVKRLVGVLAGRSTSAQLKAAEGLALLLEKNPSCRATLVTSGAIAPLVQLLGTGTRADLNTPPERAAAVLAELAKLAESKAEIAAAGGLDPLVAMLSSQCRQAQTHAACALLHLSLVASYKAEMVQKGCIPKFVKLLAVGSPSAQRFASMTLWQLSSSTEARNLIVQVGGIAALIKLLHATVGPLIAHAKAQAHAQRSLMGLDADQIYQEKMRQQANQQVDGVGDVVRLASNVEKAKEKFAEKHGQQPNDDIIVEGGAHTADDVLEDNVTMAVKPATAILAELAKAQSANRHAIVESGGLQPIIALVLDMPGGPTLQYATCVLWALAQEPAYRLRMAQTPRLVGRLVDLLHAENSETQKLAAGTLVFFAQDEKARQRVLRVDAAGPLTMLKVVADSWLRTQAEELLNLLGYAEGYGGSGGVTRLDPTTPRLEIRYQQTPRPMLAFTAPVVPMPSGLLSPRSMGGRSHTGTSQFLLERFQSKLAKNPDVWMVQEKSEAGVSNEHMAELAVKFKVKDQVLVDTESFGVRKAAVAFVGKVPEIAPGFWVGVVYSRPDGKNDGSISGVRYFKCTMDHGSFLRPNHIQADPEGTAEQEAMEEEDEVEEDALDLIEGETFTPGSPNVRTAAATQRTEPVGAVEDVPSTSAKETPAKAQAKPKLGLPGGASPAKEKEHRPTARMGGESNSPSPKTPPRSERRSKRDSVEAAPAAPASQMRNAIEQMVDHGKSPSPTKKKSSRAKSERGSKK